ncbi:MAG: hypothetical protein ABI654_14245 [Betaproteobacteria bacterium]
MRYIVQAVFALAALIGLPVFLDAPASPEGLIGAGVGALILIVIAVRSIVGYVRSRKPQSYHDSVMLPKDPPRK